MFEVHNDLIIIGMPWYGWVILLLVLVVITLLLLMPRHRRY